VVDHDHDPGLLALEESAAESIAAMSGGNEAAKYQVLPPTRVPLARSHGHY
jgi:hypothetical protein